jgi:hypothetical protein
MSERETAQTGSESPDISANGEVRSIWLKGGMASPLVLRLLARRISR